MYLDLVAPNSNGSYNRKLAKIAGLQVAVYFAELLNVVVQVIKKGTSNATTGYFTLNRKYITEMTTLSEEEQLACDTSLNKLEILEENPNDSNIVRVYLNKYEEIITTDFNKKELKNITETAKVKRVDAATLKKLGIKNNMKGLLRETDPVLRDLYCKWVDSVYDVKKNFLSGPIIQIFEDTINGYTDNYEAKKRLLNIAVIRGYKDATWIISQYERDYGVKDRKVTNAGVTTAVAKDVGF